MPESHAINNGFSPFKGIARDAFADGRVSAVSITDNPGGNPSLSPNVIGHDVFKTGMDTIVHFTGRDMNRVGVREAGMTIVFYGSPVLPGPMFYTRTTRMWLF